MKLNNSFILFLCMIFFLSMTGCNTSHIVNASNPNISDSLTKSSPSPKVEFEPGISSASIESGLSSSVSGTKVKDDVGSWVKKASMSTPRKWFQTKVVDGKIYAMGGTDEFDGYSHGLSTVEEYNPALDKWTKKASMLSERMNFRTELIDGEIYAVGGSNFTQSAGLYLGSSLSELEVYNPSENLWLTGKPMTTARLSCQTEAASGIIYAVGGLSKTNALSSMEEYTVTG